MFIQLRRRMKQARLRSFTYLRRLYILVLWDGSDDNNNCRNEDKGPPGFEEGGKVDKTHVK